MANGLCVVIGGYSGPGIGFKIGGRGNITEKNRLWRNEKQPQSIGTGVVVGKHLYRPNAGPGTIECLELATGKVVWTARAPGGNHWGSVVRVGSNLYVTGQNGTTAVFKPNPKKYEEVSANALGESSNSTPAISDGQIFLRTSGHVWCIAEAATQ